MANANYPYEVMDEGVPVKSVIFNDYMGTPAAKTLLDITLDRDLTIDEVFLAMGTGGTADSTVVDITDDGTSIFTTAPAFLHSVTDASQLRFIPDEDKKVIARGSRLKVDVTAVATAGADMAVAVMGTWHTQLS